MSGRLIILPKKTYNPWKPENVERVLRDERLERERKEKLEEADRKKQSEDRVEMLKKKRKRDGSNDDGDGSSGGSSDCFADHAVSREDTALEHVNLFADEEKAMMEKAVAGAEGSASEADQKKESSSSGIMPVYLGGEEAARRRGEKALPFYLQPSSQDKSHGGGGDGVTGLGSSSAQLKEAQAIRLRKDERLKTQMDPMHEFCKHSGSGTSNAESHSVPVKDGIEAAGVDDRRRKRHRRKRRDSYSSSSSSSESDSISSNSSSSSDEDNDSQKRKRKRHKSRGRDKNRRRNDSKRRSSNGSSARSKDGRHRRDKKRSTKRHTKDNTAPPPCASTLSIDEMRRRRQLREQKEAERSFMARLEDKSLLKGNNHKYQDQYNPTLSRR